MRGGEHNTQLFMLDIFLRLNCCNSFSHYCDIPVQGNEEEKVDNLLVSATCQYGTLAMLSSKVNGPVAHGSTQ